MKNIKFIGVTILLLGVGACSDELNQAPISNPSAVNFFRTTTDFQQAVNGLYNALGANQQTINGYAIRRFDLGETRSDDIYSPGTGVRDWNPINNFEKTLATNPYINEAWNSNYMGILRANTVLDKLNSTAVPDETVRNQMEGETKFLRAFFYFDLVRWFGKVPLILHTVTPSEALGIPRSPVADVYQAIIADLNDAIGKLPDTFTGANKGRATALAAKSILGLVYLTRTGTTYGIEGPGMGTNEYMQAVSLFNEVINSGKFSWVTNYANIFSYTNEGNPDIVFDVQAVGGSLGDVGLGARFPTEMYDGGYGTASGIPFPGGVDDDSPKAPSKSFKSSIEPGDVRYTFSVLPSYVNKAGSTINTGMFIKFLDKTKAGADRFNWPINYPVLRYTDVLMMKAEAILRGGFGSLGTQSDVDNIVNQVRIRAGLGSISNVDLAKLLNERRHEFMGEGLRWHDLVRNGMVVTTMNAWKATDDTANKIRSISENDIIYPVPQSQITVKPGLYDQNPGYN
jgi:hypothetical protein